MEKISILLAVRNGQQYIRESIESVLNQTYQNFELLICANGCTDNTITIIGDILCNSDKKDKIFLTTTPIAGKCNALNYLLNLSTAKWVAIIDADDTWQPNKLAEQVKYMPHYDVIGTKCKYMNKNGNEFLFNNPIPSVHDEIKHHIRIKKVNPIINCSALVKKSFINNFDGWNATYEGVEDFYLWAQIALLTMAKFINIDMQLVSHRIHPNSNFNSTPQIEKIASIHNFIEKTVNENA